MSDEWISVKDRLSDREKLVSIVVTNNEANVGYIHERGHWIIFSISNTYMQSAMHKVIKWTPLPKPPQKKNNE